MVLNQISQQHTSLTKVAIGWLLAVFALLSAQLALANTPPTIDSIAAGPGQAVVTFTPGLANESSPITGYRYIKDDGTIAWNSFPYAGYSPPTAIAIDAADNVYTVSLYGDFVAKATPDGTSSILGTIPGLGLAGGGPETVRGNLTGIAVDAAGNVYTASNYSYCVIAPGFFLLPSCMELEGAVWKTTPDGNSTFLGKTGNGPLGIAVDAAGNVYTANYASNNVSKITPDGDDVAGIAIYISTILGETGSGPTAIAVDAAGNVYTANRLSNNVSKITPDGASSILGTTGEEPRAIALDAAGNVYTANQLSSNMSKITPDGFSTTFETSLTIGGSDPLGIALDDAGNVYMPNNLSKNVTKITPDGTVTIFTETGYNPGAIAIDKAGNIYTADRNESYFGVTKIVDSSMVTYPATGDTSPITITGLNAAGPSGFGTEYLISLIAVSDAGESVASNRVSVTPTAPIAPDAPTIDSITPGAGQLTVAFTPGIDNGSPASSYTASCLGVGVLRRVNVVGPTSPIIVFGLYNDDTYECFVTATNSIGTSSASAMSEPFVVGAPVTFVPPPSGTPPPTYGTPPSSATPVPTSPLWLLGIMAGLLSLVGIRKLRKA